MRTRVVHKGLLIVALPVLVELLVIASLCYLLDFSDREQDKLSQSRTRMLLVHNLLFTDFKIVFALMDSWSDSSAETLDLAVKGLETARNLDEQIRQMPVRNEIKELDIKGRRLQKQMERNLSEIITISKQGLTLFNLNRVLQIQKPLVQTMTRNLSTFTRLHKYVQETVDSGRGKLRSLSQLAVLVMGFAFAANIFVALWLAAFVKKQFIDRLEIIRQNSLKLASGEKTLLPPLAGSDEIYEFDSAFHKMQKELEEAAAKEDALFENSSEVICVLNSELEFVRANKATLAHWGRTPESLRGTALKELLTGQDNDKVLDRLHESRITSDRISFELVIGRDGSKSELIKTQWSAFWSSRKDLCFATCHDVTEQRRLEELKRRFLHVLSVDFQRPLHKIRLLFEKLAAFNLSDKASKRMSDSIATMDRLLLLVNKLLELDEINSHQLKLEKADCKIKELIEAALAEIKSQAEKNDIELSYECREDLDCFLDARAMLRVYVNLLSNAIKYSPANGRISIAARERDGLIYTEISDQGKGIAKETLKALFRPFSQVKSSDGKRGKGTGLGLLICKQIVEAHGGEIGVESIEGSGSKFWFSLPLREERPAPPPGDQLEAARSNALVSGRQESAQAPNKESLLKPAISRPSGSNMSLRKKMQLLICLPLLFEFVFFAAMMPLLLKASDELSEQLRQLDITSNTQVLTLQLLALAFRTLPGSRGELAKNRQAELLNLDRSVAEFKEAIRGDALAEPIKNEIYEEIDGLKQEFLKAKEISEVSTSREDNPTLSYAYQASEHLHTLLNECVKREDILPQLRRQTRKSQTSVLLFGLAFNLTAAFMLAVFFSRDLSSRLLLLADNSKRLAAGMNLNAPLEGSDEISALDADFHRMSGQLKESREKESAFIQNSQDLIFSIDTDARISAINSKAAERMLGIPAEKILARPIYDFLKDENKQSFEKLLKRIRTTGQPEKLELSVRSQRSQNSSLDVLIAASWQEDLKAYFCIAHDISKRKEIERIRREFVSIITHDLRTPLSTILFTTKIIEATGELNQEALAILAEIDSECDRVVELINDLLDLEKFNAGQMNLNLAKIKMEALLGQVLKAVEKADSLESFSGVEFNSVSGDSGGIEINADPERLALAIAEILNQLKALALDKIRIAISKSKDGILLSFSCRASSKNEIERLLEELEKNSNFDLYSEERVRLRLPLALKIIQAHQAVLESHVSNNSGAELKLTLALPAEPVFS